MAKLRIFVERINLYGFEYLSEAIQPDLRCYDHVYKHSHDHSGEYRKHNISDITHKKVCAYAACEGTMDTACHPKSLFAIEFQSNIFAVH
jgi:hypothetical protein